MKPVRSLLVFLCLYLVLCTIGAAVALAAPEITPIGSRSVVPGSTLTFQVVATFPDTLRNVTWSVAPTVALAGAGATLTQGSGADTMKATFTWTPALVDTGVHIFRFIVADSLWPALAAHADTELVRISQGATNIDTVSIIPARIGPNMTGVRLLTWTIENSHSRPDSLKKVVITSFLERTLAAQQYQLWAWDQTDGLYHQLQSIRSDAIDFQTNDDMTFQDCLWAISPGTKDTIFVTMDVNTDHVKTYADDFDTTGVKIKVLVNNMVLRSYYSPTDSSVVKNTLVIQNQRCITGVRPFGGCYEIEFDTRIPVCSLLIFSDSRQWYGAGATNMWDGCTPGTVDLGDTIAFRMADTTCFSHYSPTMSAADSVFQSRNFPRPDSFKIDMSHYASGSATPVYIKLRRIPVGTYQDTSMHWTLKYAIPDSVFTTYPSGVRVPIDTLAGLKVYATFRDSAQNWGQYITAWQIPVDTKRPWFDSKSWSHFYNASGRPTSVDDTISIGDSLSFTIVTTGSNFIPGVREVESVSAHFYTCGFTEAAKDTFMADVGSITQNGNTIWFLKMKTDAINCLRDLEVDSIDARSWVVFTAIDNGCNIFRDSLQVNPAIDLTYPSLASLNYSMVYDADQNGCTDIGDSVKVRISIADGVTDVRNVYANYLEAGIGSTLIQPLIEKSDSVWELRTKLAENDPAYAHDNAALQYAGGTAIFPADDVDTVGYWVVDDAGNARHGTILFDPGLGRDLDTRRPLPIRHDSVVVDQQPFGVLQLSWPRLTSQDVDASWFYVYSDSGQGGSVFYPVDPDSSFGSTYDTERNGSPCTDGDTTLAGLATHNCWVSDPLIHGRTYTFVIRTVDDCGNFEFNTYEVSGLADAYADKACVQWPDPGKFWGTNNRLNLTAVTTASDLVSAYPKWRRTMPDGSMSEWTNGSPVEPQGGPGGKTFYFPNVSPGGTEFYNGNYQLVIITTDMAGNTLPLDSALTCPFTFSWNVSTINADITSINGAGTPQTQCGFDVVRDDINTFIATVQGGATGNIYTVDAWVMYRWIDDGDTLYDSTRVAYKDSVAIPYTDSFLVNDWPKSDDGIPTTLYVKFTDTRNGTSGIDMVTLCVPDEVAPDIFMTAPVAYSRVPIAKSSLNAVSVRAKVSSKSYDPDSPIRVEFFYQLDGEATWVKIGEDGYVPPPTKGVAGSTALNGFVSGPSFPEFEVAWVNSQLSEGWVWLKAVVHDEVGNTNETPMIKVYLDKTAPFMTLTIPDALTINDKLTITKPIGEDNFVNLVAEITNNVIDIDHVEFLVSYRDSVDLVKFYQLIGYAYAGTNNSIWRYEWDLSRYPWSGVAGASTLSSGTEDNDHVHLASVAGLVIGSPITFEAQGLSPQPQTRYVTGIEGLTVYLDDDVSYSSGTSATWPGAWFNCGYDYKLRVKVTDIAGNVYDDNDGDGQFDDYTFWANPWAPPISLITPADDSKLIFNYDCGAPQVAIYEVGTDDGDPDNARTYQTPSSKLGGPAEVYLKKGETLTVQSIVLDSLNDLGGVEKVEYFFKKEFGTYVSVGFATASPFSISFDPFALGLITDADVRINEDEGLIKAVLTDSLGQTTEDVITCWTLDTFPGDSKWRTPKVPYVWGDVDLSIWLLNGDEYYRQVVYKYKPAAGGDWTTITTVHLNDGGSDYFETHWPTLNQVPDGSYILGFETTDRNLNVKAIADNPQITVTVQNALPTVSIKSPADGAFICEDQYFMADATNGPVGTVDFQYKATTSASWIRFPHPSDNFTPWGKYLSSDSTNLSDGYYHFRAYATNQAGRTAYGEPITLFWDGTAPLARLTDLRASLSGETDTADVEWKNDGSAWINKAIGTVQVTAVAFDTLSSAGSQAIYNSGIDWVGLYLTAPGGPNPVELDKEYPDPADSGYYTFTWDISGLPTGQYKLKFGAGDKVDCNVGVDTVTVYIYEDLPPTSLVAGFWQPVPGEGKIVGVTYEDESVQFQYKQTGDWIPIGIGRSEVDKSLFYPDQRWQTYSVYAADWAPADGNYELRLLSGYGEDYSPVLSVTIAGGVMTATSNPTAGFGPATIERNQEEGCAMQGVARLNSTYGYPMAVGISMDLDDPSDFSYELIDFRNLPQQGTTAKYAGPFEFSEVNWGGVAYGQVFFCDYSALVGYSLNQGVTAFWITQDLGTGGPVTSVTASLKDTIIVTIPPEWNDDRAGYDDGLVIWESTKPDPCVYQDMVLTPVGNRSGEANYVGTPGQSCDTLGNQTDGSDERYAIVKMTYDASCNTPVESLMIAYWDGEGEWHTDGIFRTSKVAWINPVNHTVEFATTRLRGTYALIKRTPYVGEQIVTRKGALPVSGQYTNGYPVFWYQFVEAFPYTMDWSTLEVKVDGILVYEGGNYYVGEGTKVAPNVSTALDGEARHWDIDVDDVSAVVSVKFRPAHEGVLDDPLPLDCGSHTIWIGARTTQFSLQYLNDPFMVDCKAPHVTFPNSYVTKNPTIEFQIADDSVGVNWDSVFVDVFFVEKYDSSAGGVGEDWLELQTTFSSDQIRDYRVGENGVRITTTYELHDERAILVVVYDGRRTDSPTFWPFYIDDYYVNGAGVCDLVGNHATPSMQFLSVDYGAPRVTAIPNQGTCPIVFQISDDGSGLATSSPIVITEDGVPMGAPETSVAAVDGPGKWYFAASGDGGLLYYCPTLHKKLAVISATDNLGNVQTTLYSIGGDLSVTGISDAWAGPNPYDPTFDVSFGIHFTLDGTAAVTVKIYDMGGELVKAINRTGVNGTNEVAWDGKTSGGTRVANGVYLAHIEATQGGTTASAVVKIAVIEK